MATGVGAAAAVLFLTTFSPNVALGDAPETVAGIRSLGILHAPGYVTYVLAARAFGEVVRFGSWEFRVNLFSVVCATLTVAVAYLLARGFTANRSGAVVGASALAATTSFWFNAGFAKHYAFSGLLIVLSAFLVVRWQERRRPVLLVSSGALIGLSLGAGWQLAFIMALGLVVLVVAGPRRPTLGVVIGAAVAAVIGAVAVCAFILVRAGQDPTLNFGSASTISRLLELLTTSDFGGSRSAAGAGQVSSASSGAVGYVVVLVRDVGVGAMLIAFAGMFDVFERRRWDQGLFFGLVGVGNIVAVGLVSGLDRAIGFFTGLVSGGLLIDALVVVALLVALGTTLMIDIVEHWASARSASKPATGSRSPTPVRVAVVAVVALVVVVPSLVVHFRYASHRMPALADRYSTRVLDALPRDSVLVSGGFEFAQPFVFRQVVDSKRPDVSVVSADMITQRWYRERLVREFGLDRSLLEPNSENLVARFVDAIRQKRRVFIDTFAMYNGRSLLSYRADGFVGEIVDGGAGPKPPEHPTAASLGRQADVLRRADVEDGLAGRKYFRFPNLALYFFHERAHVELAKQFAMQGDLDRAADEIERARAVIPADINPDLAGGLRAHAADAKQFLLGM